ncbi:MAG TPA: PfkB family carbohydrate kinase [Thermoleophilaceae bacterium]
MNRVYVVGSVNVDETSVAGSQAHLGTPVRTTGGKGANAAVAAARDGAPVYMIAAVGDDDAGRMCLTALRREGVDTRGVEVVAGSPTGFTAIDLDGGGEGSPRYVAGANAWLDALRVGEALRALTERDVCVANFGAPDEALAAAGACARQRGAHLVLNVSPVRHVPPAVLAPGTTVVVNEAELDALAGDAEGSTGVPALQRRTGGAVIVTRGPGGVSVYTTGGNEVRLDAHPTTAVDTTGAGDCFLGVFAAALSRGSEIVAAARRGTAAAALAVRAVGAQTAMPSTEEIDRLMA